MIGVVLVDVKKLGAGVTCMGVHVMIVGRKKPSLLAK